MAAISIPLEVAEGPRAWSAIRAARNELVLMAAEDGVDHTRLVLRLVPPPIHQGVPETLGTCPITGKPIPKPYKMTATIQENET